MTEEIDYVDPEYVKAFNVGYMLREHLPEFVKEISPAINGVSKTSEGFKAGVNQYELQHNSLLQIDMHILKGKAIEDIELNKDLDFNKDDAEPDLEP